MVARSARGILTLMLHITEADVRCLLPMRECIGLMETAFRRLAMGEAINQLRHRLTLPTHSTLHYMAGADGRYFGAKLRHWLQQPQAP